LILSNANVSKKKCSGKGEKKMVDLGVREKNSYANGGRRVEKEMG
jgi:hypothetical protein